MIVLIPLNIGPSRKFPGKTHFFKNVPSTINVIYYSIHQLKCHILSGKNSESKKVSTRSFHNYGNNSKMGETDIVVWLNCCFLCVGVCVCVCVLFCFVLFFLNASSYLLVMTTILMTSAVRVRTKRELVFHVGSKFSLTGSRFAGNLIKVCHSIAFRFHILILFSIRFIHVPICQWNTFNRFNQLLGLLVYHIVRVLALDESHTT